jgi:predicted Zn-dependent protease
MTEPTITPSPTADTLYEQGLERYQAGEDPETLIPLFQELCHRSPKNSSAWCSLAWLYLMVDQPKEALKVAQKAAKIDPRPPQVRINLALALLDAGEKGVRSHIEVAKQIIAVSEEIRAEVMENIEDGLKRKPNWKSLQKVKAWLLE